MVLSYIVLGVYCSIVVLCCFEFLVSLAIVVCCRCVVLLLFGGVLCSVVCLV